MSVRTEKVASLIKHEIGIIFQRHFTPKEYGLLTVTDVRMSPDLKIAKVYLSIFEGPDAKEDILARLEENKKFVRTELARHVRLKFTPTLQFYLDESLDRVMNIEQILNKIHKEHPKSGAPSEE